MRDMTSRIDKKHVVTCAKSRKEGGTDRGQVKEQFLRVHALLVRAIAQEQDEHAASSDGLGTPVALSLRHQMFWRLKNCDMNT